MVATNSSMIGRTLQNRYIIRELLSAQGGFGITYRAIDTQRCDSDCVVKQLRKENSVNERLFDGEQKYLYKFNSHPQIPQLFAYFREEEKIYLVQEFIEGHDLSKEICDGKSFSEIETITLIKEILEILVYVHEHFVIHRDLKPSNIIRRKSDDKLLLIDFGAVKEVNQEYLNNDEKTVQINTCGYTPIEQILGRPTLASDIYAVGIIGIYALLGIHPRNLDLHGTKTKEVLWRNGVDVSNKFADFLDKMVHTECEQRYQNASEALTAIRNINDSSTSQDKGYHNNQSKNSHTLNENGSVKINISQSKRTSSNSRSNWQKFYNFLHTWKYE